MRPTVQDVIEELPRPAKPAENTVDGLRWGSPSSAVQGIAVVFTASQRNLERAVELGANMLISHEGEFFSHRDSSESLRNDPVCLEKRSLIERSGMAVYRLHDGVHAHPDTITEGLVRALGWDSYVVLRQPYASILEIPEMTVGQIAELAKRKLGIPFVRAVGDAAMKCVRVGITAGYRAGGELAIPLFARGGIDLLVAGEGQEWETPEYVRDAVRQGRRKALLLLGHAESEDPGMQRLAERLQTAFPDVPVHFLKQQPLFELL